MKDQYLNELKKRLKLANSCIPTVVGCLLFILQGGFFASPSNTAYASDASPAASLAAADSDAFAFEYLRECIRTNKGNVVISPYGAFSVLSMLANGADGSTRSELLRVLKVSTSLDDLNHSNAANLDILNSETKVQLKIANAIFVDNDFPLLHTFLQSMKESYKSEVANLNFADPASVKTINTWVSEKTQARIPTLIDRLRQGDCAVLINAVYFKGSWARPFDKKDTTDGAFHLEDGTVKTVSMMNHEAGFSYYKGPEFQAVSLPYKGTESLIVLLPNPDKKAADICREMNEKSWHTIFDGFQDRDIALKLPRFRVNFSLELKSILERMGMTNSFNPRTANFKALSKQPAYVGRAIQKTFIDVNEEGTEAAAATAVVMVAATAIRPAPLEFKVDRPFVIALKENKTGSLLFFGLIAEP